MFKAELNNSNILKTSFDAISSIVDEVQIQTDSEGMRLDALDRSHITFVHLELKASLFDEFICDEPEKINNAIITIVSIILKILFNPCLKSLNNRYIIYTIFIIAKNVPINICAQLKIG